jgi:hypothetical protein
MAARPPLAGARGPPQRGPQLPRTAGGGPAGRRETTIAEDLPEEDRWEGHHEEEVQ